MLLNIVVDIERVNAVLLADGWHYVLPGSFKLGTYGFVHSGETTPGVESSLPRNGFSFRVEDGVPAERYFTGPLTSILAVRTGCDVGVDAP